VHAPVRGAGEALLVRLCRGQPSDMREPNQFVKPWIWVVDVHKKRPQHGADANGDWSRWQALL